MSSTMRKNIATGRQEGMARMVLSVTKMVDNKIEIVYVGLVGWKSVDDHGHDVVPVGKAEGDLGQNHLTTESLRVEMENGL